MSNTDKFVEALDKIKGTGRFCSVGSAPFFFPRIRIAGGEELAFPLGPMQVDQITAAAERAPYGQGEATIFDESVRKSWQVDASDLVIESEAWAELLGKWLKQIAIDLGVDGEIDARLYKLLLYGEGGHFKAHRDTEKLDAMFGTLIVALPSKHSGGTLWIRHAGEEQAVDFSAAEHAYDFQYVALFADCEHEVTPVTAGYRCCLVYNLILKKGDPTLLNNLVAEQAALLQPHLESKEFRKVSEPRVALLQHQYTEANFSLAGLKNDDQSKARALLMAAEAAGYVAYLGLVTLHQEGELEGVDYYYSRRRNYWDDDDVDYDDGEMGEIYSESLSLGNWLDAYGQPVELGHFALQSEQLITHDAIDDDDPIEKAGEGPTGNAGCTMDYWYRRGAVIFWPKAQHAKIIASSNPMAACNQLLQQAKAPEAAAEPDFLELGMALIEVFVHQAEPIRDYENAPAQAVLMRAIGEAASLPLLQTVMERWGLCHFRSCSAKDWCLLFERFEADEFLPLLNGFADGPFDAHRTIVFTILQGLLSGSSDALVKVGGRFVEWAIRFKPKAVVNEPYYYARNGPSAADEAHCLLAGSFLVEDTAMRQSIREFVLTDRSLEAIRQTLVPALLQTTGERYYQEQNSLCPEVADWVRVQLETEITRAILPYPDWARPSAAKVEKLYPQFSAFLKDPVEKIYVYPARQSIREQMKQMIESEGLDVDCETVKKGRPYQLVCTKNNASYERALRVRAKDEQHLEALRQLCTRLSG